MKLTAPSRHSCARRISVTPYKAGLKHADPKDLIARMRDHQAEVMRLLGEIEVLVKEVQA